MGGLKISIYSKFKKYIKITFILFFLNFENITIESESKIYISAKSAVLICADSGDIVWEKNPHMHLPMASTTKIMTSIISLQHIEANGNQSIEIKQDMINVEGSSMGLKVGDVLNLLQLVIGMMLPSGNDAANTAAICISGNKDEFVNLMNSKAEDIGMKDTCFFTPSGLDHGDHHSSAYDMAILGAYAMKNKKFAEIVQKRKETIFLNNVLWNNHRRLFLRNHNKLLNIYEYCLGIKTGYTKRAGRCLVSYAKKDNVELVATTLDAPNDWMDHIMLYEYGFKNVINKKFDEKKMRINVKVVGGTLENLSCIVSTSFSKNFKLDIKDSEISKKIILPEKIGAPVTKGQLIGKIIYYHDDNVIGENLITASSNIPKSKKANFWRKIKESLTNFWYKITNFWYKIKIF
ncbi:MAG: D-alanyl-D-alanine carboxypeptidase [Candidatus Improbicoccus pseudotrichonymphae]|uniref:serine-type D-Ala-D-Ala carboxypeptidase n=1 Tax=Candidatus Improbicoccus pseudotrichonymphae TaxID=3033792 RepID=A0AA48KWP3_9FIRM|nr:MAG: D-alanyl-D-alanine carboxypeptidase [Candidatus Improbicoccus pseudotrichonymphae]